MVQSTIITRLDGMPLAASVDDAQVEENLQQLKEQAKMIFRRLTPNSEPQASIESGQYTLHYLIQDGVCYLCICDRSYPRKLAFTYLADIATEFASSYPPKEVHSPGVRPYQFVDFDTFMQRTKRTYQDTRATQNLDKLNDDLKDVTRIMTKNIEDLLYRGDSLDKMGDMSVKLKQDSAKYKKAARRINWDLLLRQYAPFGVLGFIIILFIYLRFF
ncbi:Vesicle-trafficking protein S22a [Orbilia brochopaga]|uniref:Protein transport protein SEC22 n=1 Tax=Orbilia brochopaga TaxID=3140254 RepID=A0AAV9UPU5_9PEZI